VHVFRGAYVRQHGVALTIDLFAAESAAPAKIAPRARLKVGARGLKRARISPARASNPTCPL
jgi:hypothetical protein